MYYDPAATGERIQNLRKDREVTQEQLAIDLNISDRYMRNLEKGEKVPSVDLFVELRERFGSSLDYIVLGVSASQREQSTESFCAVIFTTPIWSRTLAPSRAVSALWSWCRTTPQTAIRPTSLLRLLHPILQRSPITKPTFLWTVIGLFCSPL